MKITAKGKTSYKTQTKVSLSSAQIFTTFFQFTILQFFQGFRVILILEVFLQLQCCIFKRFFTTSESSNTCKTDAVVLPVLVWTGRTAEKDISMENKIFEIFYEV